uniref:RRM domain-containing protein n=1 Tax=Athene cunicularia TaxID=194338 RepID=A0A663M221_ATHCN
MELEKNSDVKSKRRCFNQTFHLLYSEKAEHTLVRDVAAGANHSGCDTAPSANVSELKVSEESLPYLNSSLDADIEKYSKNRMRICCAQEGESKKEADLLGRACDNTHFDCGMYDDCRKSHLGEDSQLEYLSAHEQDFDDRNSSIEFSEQRETVGIKTLKLIDPLQEVPGGGVSWDQNLTDVSKGCSSKHGVGDQACSEAATPELPHLPQDSLLDCSDMACDHQDEQTEYHSVCRSLLESHSCGIKEKVCPNLLVCDSLKNGEVKDIPLIDSTLPLQTATTEEVSEKNDRHIHSISVKQDNPFLSPQERASAIAMQFCEHAGDPDFYSCEESGVCAGSATLTDRTAKDAETQFLVSEILTSKNLFSEVEVADKSSCGNISCLNSVLEHCENRKKVTGDSTINQAVDASADFRACFTTSRSTSAQVCLSSRAINTEITMMNKSRPAEWHHETFADVACNTDWSCGAGSAEEIWSQLTDNPKDHSSGNTASVGSLPPFLAIWLVHLDKQAVKNSASSYTQKILQRAIEAELQILNSHYQMCYQHCLKIYKLALEETTCFSSNGNNELGSSLMLVLEELKKSYNSMRMKIKMGVPLNALPPLSVEMKVFQVSSSYVPCYVKNEEWNEYWFDAKDDLTVTDFSVTAEEMKKQQEKQDMVDLRGESGNECSFIRVGGLCSSVSEDDLRLHFQKYQISDIVTCVDSGNYRYAFLCFKDTNKAKLAVEEMNQKKIKGKPVSVELVNHSSDNKSSVSQILTNKLWHEIQPDTGEKFPQKTCASSSTNSYDTFISPDTLHLSSFNKLMKNLQEIHPEASRDKILNALLEVRRNNRGVLSGLSISSIVEWTSVILTKSTPSCGWEKQCN